MTNKIQTLKVFRDFLPETMRVRNYILNIFKSVFESFGFEPLETPALEYAETLLGKYGKEADKLVYTFEDKGKRKIGLRYDLTVPVSRVLAQYRDKISLPFKRYQIQTTWRAEKPQKGRYREFVQCDVDTFGIFSPLADAEIVAVIYNCLRKLNFEKFVIRINSRQVLFEILKRVGIKDKNLQLLVLQTIDKLAKRGEPFMRRELEKKKISKATINNLFNELVLARPDENLKEMFEFIEIFGVDKRFYKFDPTLVRGLDYYTGPIFETYVEKPKIGSITGGGRYDKLISQLGGPDIPATGTTIGLDRVCDVILELGLLKEKTKPLNQILVTIFDDSLVKKSLEIFSFLKERKFKVQLYPNPDDSMRKQLKYADKKEIPFILIIGPQEIKGKSIIIKIMKTREQIKVKNKELIPKLKEIATTACHSEQSHARRGEAKNLNITG